MKALYPEQHVVWDPYYGSPDDDDLFLLSLKEYDDFKQKKSGKKQYHTLSNIRAELASPFRCVAVCNLSVFDCWCVCFVC